MRAQLLTLIAAIAAVFPSAIQAQTVLLEIDISDPTAVVIRATGASPLVNYAMSSGGDGVLLDGLFDTDINLSSGVNMTGNLTPNELPVPYVFGFNETSFPGVQLTDFILTAGGDGFGVGQVFDVGQPAFTGAGTLNLSSAQLTPGTTGDIVVDGQGDYVNPDAIIGQFMVVVGTGACCIDEVCFEDQTEDECVAAGGDFRGIDSECASTNCAETAILLEVDISNPAAVVFRATGESPLVTYHMSSGLDGVLLDGFFSSDVDLSASVNVTGDLAANGLIVPYRFAFNETSFPGVQLTDLIINAGGDGGGIGQFFTVGEPAFTGEGTIDLSGIPIASGTRGDIVADTAANYADPDAILGQFIVVGGPGACCVDGICFDSRSEHDCLAFGGVFLGTDSDCDSAYCISDPCTSAQRISEGDTTFSTIGASTDGSTLPQSCDEGSGLSFHNDIWFEYIPTASGILTVATCDDANFDTRLAAYSGDCDGLQFLACNDDAADCVLLRSRMEVPVTNAVPVLIRLGAFDTFGQGVGTLNLTLDPCPVDFNQDGLINSEDFFGFINAFVNPGSGCF